MPHQHDPSSSKRAAWRIAGIYALVAGIWITASDALIADLVSDPRLLVQISLYKGVLFVVATAALLYILVARSFASVMSMDEALRQSDERFRATFEQAAVGIAHVGLDGRWLRVNRKLCEILGYTGDELSQLTFQELTFPADLDRDLAQMRRMLAGEAQTYSIEKRYIRGNHAVVWTNLTVSVVRETLGKPKYFIAVLEDITARKRGEDQLRLSAQVFESAGEAIVIADAAKKAISVNEAFSRITGYSVSEVSGRKPSIFAVDDEEGRLAREIWATVSQTGHWQGEVWDRRRNGDVYPVWLAISAVVEEAQVKNYIAIFSDITERKAADERIRYLAQHDPLTGLPNRTLLQDRLQQAFAQAQREGSWVAILSLDLDRFKHVNDSLGHHLGDRTLQAVAGRFIGCLRGSDTVCRHGGDEFFVVLPEVRSTADVAHAAEKILRALSAPYHVGGIELHLGASIGISVYPADGHDSDSLLKNAETAMAHAKERGRNSYQFFRSDMNASAIEHLSLETKLRAALEHDELVLHYQPQTSIASGEIVGLEALVRWRHPQLGLMPPAKFIPIAEETGLISDIGDWVLRTACEQNRRWQEEGAPSVPVAVNLSGMQLRQKDLPQWVMSVLEQTGLEPRFLDLELTEAAAMKNAEATIVLLSRLKAGGVRLSIDDFGTGYSSLSQLRRFPVDKLKIDQSFVRDMTADPDAAAITRSIISMAHSLRLEVVAEGVETEAQLDMLRAQRCEEVQGYYFSEPLPAEELGPLLHGRTRLGEAHVG